MREKRYEIFKRNELDGRNPQGINALGDEENDLDGGILHVRSRNVQGAPRSQLNNSMKNDLLNSGMSPNALQNRQKNSRKK